MFKISYIFTVYVSIITINLTMWSSNVLVSAVRDPMPLLYFVNINIS